MVFIEIPCLNHIYGEFVSEAQNIRIGWIFWRTREKNDWEQPTKNCLSKILYKLSQVIKNRCQRPVMSEKKKFITTYNFFTLQSSINIREAACGKVGFAANNRTISFSHFYYLWLLKIKDITFTYICKKVCFSIF